MTAPAQHTPTPFHDGGAVKIGPSNYTRIVGDGVTVCLVPRGGPYGEGNAALIVRAVNSHAALVEALENARNLITLALKNGAWGDESTDDQDSADEARGVVVSITAALALAKGE